MEWSCLNSTLNKIGITDSKNCNNCLKPETTSHYFCNAKDSHSRDKISLSLLSYIKLSVPNIKVTTDLLLNGSSELTLTTMTPTICIVDELYSSLDFFFLMGILNVRVSNATCYDCYRHIIQG